jgi:chromosome partitioning protein
MKVIATGSIKGGVGKTSSSVNLAYEATRSGARVLVWDIDPQGSATYLLRVEHRLAGGGAKRLVAAGGQLAPHVRATAIPGLHLLPSDLSLRFLDRHLDAAGKPRRRIDALLRPLGEAYDLVILDCPPGASLAIESVLRAADVLLIPVVPTTLAMLTLVQFEDIVARRSHRPELLAHVSMLDRRKRLQREIVEELLERPETLSTVVPNASVVERMGPARAPVALFAPRSSAAEAYRQLWQELAARLWS